MLANRLILALRALLLPDLPGISSSLRPLRSSAEWDAERPTDREAYQALEDRATAFLLEVGDNWPDEKAAFLAQMERAAKWVKDYGGPKLGVLSWGCKSRHFFVPSFLFKCGPLSWLRHRGAVPGCKSPWLEGGCEYANPQMRAPVGSCAHTPSRSLQAPVDVKSRPQERLSEVHLSPKPLEGGVSTRTHRGPAV